MIAYQILKGIASCIPGVYGEILQEEHGGEWECQVLLWCLDAAPRYVSTDGLADAPPDRSRDGAG